MKSEVKTPFLRMLLFVIALVPCVMGCGSDDDEPTTKSSITLDGQSFKIHSASLIGVSLDGEGHATINFVSTDGSLTKSLGIDIEYSPDQPVSGTYSFPQSGTDRYLDDWLTNYTEMTQTSSGVNSESASLVEGSVTVRDNGGSNYTVTMDLTMEDGKVFKGTYQGQMQTVFNNG